MSKDDTAAGTTTVAPVPAAPKDSGKPGKPGQKCLTCTHWGPVGRRVSGFCRKENPRKATVDKMQDVSFPVTMSHEWCDSWTKGDDVVTTQ